MSGVHLTSGAQNPYTNSGNISGYGYGLIADNIGGVTWTVTNVGKIVETGNSGVGVALPDGTFKNAGYVIAEGLNGIGVAVTGYVVNTGVGSIDAGPSGIGVQLSGGSLVNRGNINGGESAVGVEVLDQSSIANSARITGKIGVSLQSGGSFGNGNTAYTFGGTAVYVGASAYKADVFNDGTIAANNIYNPSFSFGVLAQGSVAITNGDALDMGATIKSQYGYAIVAHGSYASISNMGTIEGGIHLTHGELNNTNLITGSSYGLYTLDWGDVLNSGTIKGGLAGVRLGGVVGDTVINNGFIVGENGVESGGGSIINYGGIYGGVPNSSPGNAGVILQGGTYNHTRVTAVLDNHGFIQGPTGAIVTSGTVDNFGQIVGTYGPAIEFLGSRNRLIVEAGSSLAGVAEATGAGNILQLGSGGGLVSGLGANFVGFQTLQVNPHASWTLFGTNASTNETVSLGAGAKLTVLGSLTNGGGLTLAQNGAKGGTVTVSGYLDALGGLTMTGADTVRVVPGGALQVGSGTGAASGKATIMAGASISGSGTIASNVVDLGGVVANGALSIVGAVKGAGSVTIDTGSTLNVKGALACATAVFAAGGSAETLALGTATGDTAVISGFGGTDAIDMLGLAANGENFSAGVLTLTEAGTTVATLHLAGSFTSANFALGSDGAGGTKVTWVAAAGLSPAGLGGVPGHAAFVSAMAGMAPVAAETVGASADPGRAHGAGLAVPAHAVLA